MRAAIYVRVSTKEQDYEQQIDELRREAKRRGWTVDAVFAEKASGANTKRPELERLLHQASLNQFRAVLVWSVSRLGRNLPHVAEITRELMGRGVLIVSKLEGAFEGRHGQIVADTLAMVGDWMREELRAATRRGLEHARRKGKRLGRPPLKLDPHQVAYIARLNGKAYAARHFKVSLTSIRRMLIAAGREGVAKKGQGILLGAPERKRLGRVAHR